MNIVNIGHTMQYEMQCLVMLFFPGEKIVCFKEPQNSAEDTICVELVDGKVFKISVCVGDTQLTQCATVPLQGDRLQNYELTAGTLLYHMLSHMTGIKPKWGILTGIRPVKRAGGLLEQGLCAEQVAEIFRTQYLVAEDKISLALATAQAERAILAQNTPKSYSLYLSIPFCPSRCHYCSFVSSAITTPSAKKLIEPYVEKLVEEIRLTGALIKPFGLKLETVYFGGGTPTTLTAAQLQTICTAVAEHFPLAQAQEYTVEAGRPDTITREKLEVLKAAGVNRISINPQTLNDAVLRKVGRNHTAQQTLDSFSLAREVGFTNINMDLIAGLPGDTPESFRQTMQKIIALSPENVTVHTLSVKRSADYGAQKQEQLAHTRGAGEMVDYAQKVLPQAGYHPYYLYRQKQTLDNLENTGYCKLGFEGLYNIFIMDEAHTILALGAGASTKLCNPSGAHLERIFNFKYPFEYINRFEELMERKKKVVQFYEKNNGEYAVSGGKHF